jgi:hypothetical protein
MKYLIMFFMLLPLLSGCPGGDAKVDKIKSPLTNQLSDAGLQKLSQKKIFFGHQSVGDNVLDGIRTLMQSEKTVRLNIVKTESPGSFTRPIFAHTDIGKNDDPNSKIAAFRDYMANGIGNKADIVFFKFCFWDIRSKTDIQQIFSNYKAAMTELKARYPKVVFVHFTVPLMSHQNGLKDKIKRSFYMKNESDLDNMKRNELNEMLLREYEGKEPLFDIAKFESTLPDGKRVSFSEDGKFYYCLASDYTTDGGHLNDLGKKVAANQLLIFLSRLSEQIK